MRNLRAQAYHNLAIMLEAGVPAAKALATAGRGARGLDRAMTAMAASLAEGASVREAMSAHGRLFEAMDVLVVGVGETAGKLPEAFDELSKWHSFRSRLTATILSGLVLPVLIFHAAAFIVPAVPLLTGSITLAQYLAQVASYLALFYIPAGVIWLIVRLTPKAGLLRLTLDRALLAVPSLGKGLKQLALSRYCRVFHMLCTAGVPVDRAAQLATDACGNAVVARQLAGGVRSVRAGQPVSAGFDERIGRDFRATWLVGEESGKLDECTLRLANSTGAEAERWLEQFGRWMPKLVYALVSVFIIYQIFGSLDKISTMPRP